MIETETLILWARDLCTFVNGDQPPLFTKKDADPAMWPGEETRTPKQTAALRATAQKGLAVLAEWKHSARGGVPEKLVRMAENWLDHPLVRSTNLNYTPMDGALSLSDSGQLQVVPLFRSIDAQYAVTFAELIQKETPAFIRQCPEPCKKFWVNVRGARGYPRELCDEHYAESKRSKKWTKVKTEKSTKARKHK